MPNRNMQQKHEKAQRQKLELSRENKYVVYSAPKVDKAEMLFLAGEFTGKVRKIRNSGKWGTFRSLGQGSWAK